MKKIPLLFLFALFISSLCAQNLTNNMDSVSYSVGVLIAKNLKSQGMDAIDAPSMAAAVADVFEDKALIVPAAFK